MPAYNAAPYISQAIASVRAQTVADWELVIVDDGSTDDTLSLAMQCADTDDRISVSQMDAPSGSAYQPRKAAIMLAEAEFVSPLDADDFIEPSYLEQLLEKQSMTGADIVYPTMWFEKNGSECHTPSDAALYEGAYTGRDCVWLTLDGWRINCNGGLIRKQSYIDTFEKYGSHISYSCADELLTRQLLLMAGTVAFSPAKYFYRFNPASITRRQSVKLFDFLINNIELIGLTGSNFGHESKEYLLAQRQNFHGIFDALRLLNKYDFDRSERDLARKRIMEARKRVGMDFLKPHVSPRYMALLRAGLPAARICLRTYDGLVVLFGHL